MTVPSTKNVKTHLGNGVTTVFPFDFRIFQAEDLEVSLTLADDTIVPWTLGTDYTVAEKWEDVQSGGEIIATAAPDDGTTLVIRRVLEPLQETDLRNQGAYYAEVVERVFDRLTMLIQQVIEDAGRSLKHPIGEDFWDGEGKAIKNIITATIADAQDVANVGWVQEYVTDILAGGGGAIPETYLLLGDGVETTFPLPGIEISASSAYTVTIDGLDMRPKVNETDDWDYRIDVENEQIIFLEPPPAPASAGDKLVMVRVLGYKRGITQGDATIVTADGTSTSLSLSVWMKRLLDAESAIQKRVKYVDNVTELLALTGLVDGQRIRVTAYQDGWAGTARGPKGGGMFTWVASSEEAPNGGTVFQSAAGGTGRFVRDESESLDVECFGVRSSFTGDYALNTARMQAAWDYSGASGKTLTFASNGVSDPYYVTGLNLVDGLSLSAEVVTVIELPSSSHGGTGFFISRPDDGDRYRRIRMSNIWFATATSSVSAAQDANQNLGGMNLAGCESGVFDNLYFTGFGQGGCVLARAEGGAEGLGLNGTTQDGNYNTFFSCNGNACGKYRADEQTRAVFVLLYKANSNNFYATYSRGNPDSSTIAIKYGSNNNVYGGTGETVQYSVRLGALAGNNNVAGMRGEGVTAVVKAYEYTGVSDANGPLVWNTVHGIHLSSGTDEVEFDTGHNTFQSGTARNPLRYRRSISASGATIADGLIDALGLKCRPGVPVYVMSTGDDGRSSNTADNIPRIQMRKNHNAASNGDVLAEIEFYNSDTSTGAAGVSAKIAAVMSSSGGDTDLVFYSGTGTTLTEKMRVKANGRINMSSLPTSASGLSAGDLWNDAGTVKIV